MNQQVQSVAFVTVAHHTADEERALTTVNGEVLLKHTVQGLLGTPELDLVVVSAPSRCASSFSAAVSGLSDRCRFVPGESLRQVFTAVEPALAPDAVILVHDALRAFTPQRTVRDVLTTIREGASVVVPVLPMADTVKSTDAGLITATVDRDGLRTAQTPIGFSLAAFRTALTLSADPGLDSVSGAHTVPGDPDAMRVATAFELTLAEALVAGGDQEAPL
ncbi:2-C-methyl-D-erythritol 4-phosphate cytidylyltransferase [Amycolatopsis rhabdoformis]|uniref:2-C-methyl-D-erythritol 4-phosphate cytidylyltransferase n=1 Tax=Amycolatopsis rhabdoformis TaxID=1448059 RepID=A0ABZ1HZY7_9PSEU|nr:2-C-methyl-D-erythritol 4-phosphate cytidylyltransferase [Amycolatopsis rhabdoformis]WSE27697.1 2-C-methyl-D-erythritol 4-phosphate cytidylyltransferase [Amycolatopsis rhabdoformis]